MVAVYCVLYASGPDGVSVAVFVEAEYATVAVTEPPPPVRVNAEAVIVDGSIASLKVAVRAEVIATPVEFDVGVTAVTVGGVAATVVNVQESFAASAVPAESVTPVVTVTVYCVL
jgi:hypothetical protein